MHPAGRPATAGGHVSQIASICAERVPLRRASDRRPDSDLLPSERSPQQGHRYLLGDWIILWLLRTPSNKRMSIAVSSVWQPC